jgi:hypothetical protein
MSTNQFLRPGMLLHQLPHDMWKSLSTEAQTAWVNIPEADRRIILGNVKSSPSSKSTKSSSSLSIPNCSSFLHSIEETPNDEIADTELSATNDDVPDEQKQICWPW